LRSRLWQQASAIPASRSPYPTADDATSSEAAITLSAAAQLPELQIDGQPQKPSTMQAWVERGIRGIVLESWRIGGVKVTSRAAVARFLEKLNSGETARAGTVSPNRQRQHRQAEQLLDRAGI
jgi:hypothetical protein